jgi:hypothetical protein
MNSRRLFWMLIAVGVACSIGAWWQKRAEDRAWQEYYRDEK